MRGGLSGGTLASMMGQLDEVQASAERRQLVSDRYALSPDRAAEPGLGDERDLDRARYDGGLRMWTGPWLMAGINTRVVRRSNALQGWAYGRRFRYREVTGFGASPAAPALAATAGAGTRAAEAALAFGPSRALLRRLLPAPGHGPGEKTRRTGFFRIQIHTRTTDGHRYLATIEAQGDPGYAATSVMLGETALCLALDKDQLPGRAGVLTPATAMGAALAARLKAAGHTLATRQITALLGKLPHPWLVSPGGRAPHSPPVADWDRHSTDGDTTRSGSHQRAGRARSASECCAETRGPRRPEGDFTQVPLRISWSLDGPLLQKELGWQAIQLLRSGPCRGSHVAVRGVSAPPADRPAMSRGPMHTKSSCIDGAICTRSITDAAA